MKLLFVTSLFLAAATALPTNGKSPRPQTLCLPPPSKDDLVARLCVADLQSPCCTASRHQHSSYCLRLKKIELM
ncbi:hypothetical protein BN1723_008061 [Verticillium longisporum]|uniref:Hydrophobin n=1 Tax=Verticillium longisporum TaxID=100787 RepID=A0A0G4MBD3_VERLO|nr:hypothetical protein BN1708_005439 [Verticillium longisporum]CRK48521.1 hypothetical protein BN1723_008061 [Verticillium longisporum]